MNLKYLGEGEVRKIMKSLGMICHIYILNVKQDLQPLPFPTVVISMYIDVEKCASRTDFKFFIGFRACFFFY